MNTFRTFCDATIHVQRHQLFPFLLLWSKYVICLSWMPGALSWTSAVTIGIPTVLACTLLIPLLMHKVAFRAMWLMNWLWTIALLAIVVCYEQYGIVVTYKALFQVNQAVDVHDSIAALMHPVYVLLAIDFILLAIAYVGSRKHVLSMKRGGRWTFALWMLVLVWLGAQGTLYRDVLNELSKFQRMGLLAYQVVALAEDRIPQLRPYKPDAPLTPDVIRLLKRQNQAPFLPKHFAQAYGKNLIVVQLESFQQFLLPLVIEGKHVTPNLHQLTQETLYFPNIFQSISQGNTADAEFVVNTSFYPPFSEAASHKYGQKVLPSLPRRLHDRGYTSVTLHTNTASFWNRDALYPALGFDRYYDSAYFGKEDVIAFGASDTVLYEKTLPVLLDLQNAQRPFYAHIIAQSSHHPFRLPAHHQSLSLPRAWENTFVGDYVRSAHYVDAALGAFVADLKRTGLWEQSVFVVYGDHFGLSPHSLKQQDQALLSWALGHSYDFQTQFNIPLLIASSGIAPRTVTQVGGHIDIMPTLAALLGINVSEDIVFGQDLLIPSYNAVTSRFYMPKGSFIDNDTLYWSGETFEKGKARKLRMPKTPVALQRAHYETFLHLLYLLSYNDDYLESLQLRDGVSRIRNKPVPKRVSVVEDTIDRPL